MCILFVHFLYLYLNTMEKIQAPLTQTNQYQAKQQKYDSFNHNSSKPFVMPEKKLNCLSNIMQLTEEQQTQGKTIITQFRGGRDIKSRKGQINQQIQSSQQKQNNPKSFFSFLSLIYSKGVNCLISTYSKIYQRSEQQKINVSQSQISKIISRLKKKRSNSVCFLPAQRAENEKKRTLVLDLDETLIFLSFQKTKNYDYTLNTQINGIKSCIYISKRFGLDSFLFQMAKIYEIVVFSTLKRELVEKLVSIIDPRKNISHVLSREHCIVINKFYYIKCLKDLGRDRKNIIAVDTHGISASLNPENFYKIQTFRGSIKDRKLVSLAQFLKHLHEDSTLTSIIPIERLRKKFESIEIDVSEKQMNSFNQNNNDSSDQSTITSLGKNLLNMISKNRVENQIKDINEKQLTLKHKKTRSSISALVSESQVHSTAPFGK